MHAILVLAVLAAAPQAPADDPAPRGVAAVYLQAGLSAGEGRGGSSALGGTAVFDLGSRFALEASGTWLPGGMGPGHGSSLSAGAALLFNLRSSREKAVPYLLLGGGVYHTSFDMDRMMDDGGPGFMGSGAMPGFMGGPGSRPGMPGGQPQPGWMPAMPGMPRGYQQRVLGRMAGMDGRGPYGEASFTDPAISVGAGLRIDLGSHVFLRPDGRALFVPTDGETTTLGVFSLNVGYRF